LHRVALHAARCLRSRSAASDLGLPRGLLNALPLLLVRASPLRSRATLCLASLLDELQACCFSCKSSLAWRLFSFFASLIITRSCSAFEGSRARFFGFAAGALDVGGVDSSKRSLMR
jgi:hypothetical protein